MEADEVEGASEGRARVSGDEAEVRIRESALPGAEEERASVVCHLRSGQPVCQSQQTAARGVILCPLRMAKGGQKGARNKFQSSRVVPEVAILSFDCHSI